MRLLLLGVIACLLAPATPRLGGHDLGEDGKEVYETKEGGAFHMRHVSEPLVAGQRDLSVFSSWFRKKKGSQAGAEEDGQAVTKDFLNGLVEATAAKTSEQLANIAFMKTHKTASTTLAYLLYRYARRHNLKLAHFDHHGTAVPLIEAVHQTQWGGKGRCDIMHYHVSPFGQYDGTWEEAENAYRGILRESEAVNFITVMREPRSHLLSYYYYFIQPQTKKSIVEFLTSAQHAQDPLHRRLFNPLSAEFGVYKRQDLDYMIQTGFPHQKLILLTEEFDEGLMVMRRLLGWEMVDMTYVSMYKTVDGAHRFDGKLLVSAPHFEDLPEHVQKIIDNKTQLDQVLYKAAKQEYEKRRDTVAQYLEADLEEFEQLQDVVKTYLNDNPTSKANVMYKSAAIYAPEKQSPLYEF